MSSKCRSPERVRAALRADILSARISPGQKLRFSALCQEYGASVGVVREALSGLVEQRLVTMEAQQGFRVVTLSPQDLADLTEARVCVESLALRSTITRGSLAWESELLAAHHVLEGTPMLSLSPTGDLPRLTDAWSAAHLSLHEMLLAGCPNQRLRGIASGLRDSAELYRRWSVSQSGAVRDAAGEHRAILEAVLARDAERAVRLLGTHYERTAAAFDQDTTNLDLTTARARRGSASD
jgi:DNA-binding GntR family transcriptional regulator